MLALGGEGEGLESRERVEGWKALRVEKALGKSVSRRFLISERSKATEFRRFELKFFLKFLLEISYFELTSLINQEFKMVFFFLHLEFFHRMSAP